MSKEYAFKLKGFVFMIPCRQYCSNITKNVIIILRFSIY